MGGLRGFSGQKIAGHPDAPGNAGNVIVYVGKYLLFVPLNHLVSLSIV
jgi:hypothetical protein